MYVEDIWIELKNVLFDDAGAPRVATARVKLPVKLVIKPVAPVKNAEFKLTLDSNKPPANLNEIFPGLYTSSSSRILNIW